VDERLKEGRILRLNFRGPFTIVLEELFQPHARMRLTGIRARVDARTSGPRGFLLC
jgi:hypothetical protein